MLTWPYQLQIEHMYWKLVKSQKEGAGKDLLDDPDIKKAYLGG